MSDVILHYDKTDNSIDLLVNGHRIEHVAAVNLTASKVGSVCTVVFEAGSVDIQALTNRLALGEEMTSHGGGN